MNSLNKNIRNILIKSILCVHWQRHKQVNSLRKGVWIQNTPWYNLWIQKEWMQKNSLINGKKTPGEKDCITPWWKECVSISLEKRELDIPTWPLGLEKNCARWAGWNLGGLSSVSPCQKGYIWSLTSPCQKGVGHKCICRCLWSLCTRVLNPLDLKRKRKQGRGKKTEK